MERTNVYGQCENRTRIQIKGKVFLFFYLFCFLGQNIIERTRDASIHSPYTVLDARLAKFFTYRNPERGLMLADIILDTWQRIPREIK